jgi:predicted nucleotidyltransferase
MSVLPDEVVAKIVQTIVREVDPERIYLFGSHARGQSRRDSDLDLLIIDREPFGSGRGRLQEVRKIYRALSPFRVPKDILLYSSEEFFKWRDSANHIIGTCSREGVLLYERS